MSNGIRITYKEIDNKNYKEENIGRIGNSLPQPLPDIRITKMKKS